jgi:mono/diheme cytochrome c family protein
MGNRTYQLLAVVGEFAFFAWLLAACGGANDTTMSGGEGLYRSSCAQCHGITAAGDVGPNISGSTRAGIGGWTRQQFFKAVRAGVDDEGQELCAQMPHFSQSALSDEQLANIHDYLLTVVNDRDSKASGCR